MQGPTTTHGPYGACTLCKYVANLRQICNQIKSHLNVFSLPHPRSVSWALAENSLLLSGRPFSLLANASVTNSVALANSVAELVVLTESNPADSLCARYRADEPVFSHLDRAAATLTMALSSMCAPLKRRRREKQMTRFQVK